MNSEIPPAESPPEIWQDPELFDEFDRLVLEDLGPKTIEIACVVSRGYLFDFAIFYESLLNSWTFYPFRVHAFASSREAYEALLRLELPHVEVRLLPTGEDGSSERWRPNALQKIRLIEHSGLERCIVSDIDNIFLAETPELFMLLHGYDLVFVGSPAWKWALQTHLWAFKKNTHSVEFSRRWYERSKGIGGIADAGGLPFALLYDRPEGLAVKVLARPKPESNPRLRPAPYDVQVNIRPFVLSSDPLGFREEQMGRAKVIHVAGLRAKGNESLAARIDELCERWPHFAPFLPLYVTLATKAADRLGMEKPTYPQAYLRTRLHLAGVMAHRRELPGLLNDRGLVGQGVEVGVERGDFSELILRRWKGNRLISVDPWKSAPADEYKDVSNVSQEEHDLLYEQARRRLAPFGDRSVIWRTTSAEAAERVTPGSLDFVYLDARHDYESVKSDLEFWYDKIRPGGFLGGHDYLDGQRPQGVFGVKSAVDDFFGERGLEVKETYADRPWSSWFVEIPREGAAGSDDTG
jgi:hypothetical protein